MGKIILILLILIQGACNFKEKPKAKNGELSIELADLESPNKVALSGEWEIYWNEGFGESLFSKIDSEDFKLTTVPNSWNSIRPGGKGGDGLASYRLKLKVPTTEFRYYLRLTAQTSAYQFYVNRQKLAEVGVVGDSKETSKPKNQIQYVSFQPVSLENELILVVSNFQHARGGFRKPIEIGRKEVIQNLSLIYSGGEVFIFGALLTMALYQLTVFLIRREEKSSFYFSMFCFLTGLRLVVLDNYYIVYIFPNFPWELMQRIDYGSAPLMASFFLSFLQSLFPGKSDVPKWIVQLSWAIAVLFLIFVISFPAKIFTEANLVSLVIILFFSICSFWISFNLFRQKKKDTGFLFFGTVLLLIGSTHDALAGNNVFQAQPIMPFGLFFFFLFQSILLARRNARIYSSMESLTTELQEINHRLDSSNRIYSKFVPLRLLELFNENHSGKIKRGDFVTRKMTVLSSDIRDFTSISEALSPEENFLFLNDYLSHVGPIIRAQNGFIEKYIGDAVFALFDRKPEDAITAAIQMHHSIAKWNAENTTHRVPKIQIGIGIHFGELMLGIIGEEQRIESAVLSDSMGVANSLEAMTKKYGAKIILSLDALLELQNPDSYPHRILDFIKLPSKERLVGIAQILVEGLEENFEAKVQSKITFETAVNAFWDGDFELAEREFSRVVEKDPKDKAAVLYLEKTKDCLKNGPPPGFSKGVLS